MTKPRALTTAVPSKKLTTPQILRAALTQPDHLRNQGFGPQHLLESAEQSFKDKQNIRARIQLRTMARVEPLEKEETPLFETSGNLLSDHGYPKQAAYHWTKAYNKGHQPYDMSMKLGHYKLTNGQLNDAQIIFSDQSSRRPEDPIVHNELGVTQFMSATRQNDIGRFSEQRHNALSSFEKSLSVKVDSVVEQNKKVATCLSHAPLYSGPFWYLKPRLGTSTRMIDALIRDLSNNKTESKSAPGIGFTPVNHPKGGTSIEPTFTTQFYQVPRIANELALYELAKIKQEQPDIESSRMLKK